MIQDRSRSVDTDRLHEAFERHARSLLRLCVLVTGRQDVAEELLQEAFERVSRAGTLHTLEGDAELPYLRATVLNLWRNRLRRLAIERRARPVAVVDPEPTFEQRDELWAAVRGLPPRQRACIVLRYYEQLSERETAGLLGCSIGTVKSQTSRALARLRREIADDDR